MARIVFADDDPNNRYVIGVHLQLMGHEVRFAENGRQALDLIAAARPDLVILDLMMPEMNGYDACRALRLDPGTTNLPVLLLTALDHRDGPDSEGARFDAVVGKPFRVDELQAIIDRLLREPIPA